MSPYLLFLFLAISSANASFDGFRVKHGTNGSLADQEYLFSLPRTLVKALRSGWIHVPRPRGPLPQLPMLCRRDDVNVCLLFDVVSGFVAGLQIAIPTATLDALPIDPSTKFVRWRNQRVGHVTSDYWTTTVFFVSEGSLAVGNHPTAENGNTIQENGVWVLDPSASNQLKHIPLKEVDIAATPYTIQGCVHTMGLHYYYDMSTELDCSDFFPWFVLLHPTTRELIGVGFQYYGKVDPIGSRNWFETPTSALIPLAFTHYPRCFVDLVDEYGGLSLHQFFINQPWGVFCPTS